MSEKILVVGASGFIGQNICCGIENAGYRLSPTTEIGEDFGPWRIRRLDLTKPSELKSVIKTESPDIVINSAGLISVRGCEDNPNLADLLNAIAVGELANACITARVGLMCQLSTDAVFGGNSNGAPFSETDVPTPSNKYGSTKLDGENIIKSSGVPFQIIRTSVVVGDMPYPNNRLTFQRSLINSLTNNEVFYAMDDAVNSPTNVDDVVEGMLYLINSLAYSDSIGIFHLAGPRSMSKYELAKLIATRHNLNPELVKPTTREKIDPSYPANTSLDSTKLAKLGFQTREPLAVTVPA